MAASSSSSSSAAAAPEAPPQPPPMYRTMAQPKVYLVGDSMTETGFHWQNGWGLELTRRLLRRADVLNRGVGGYTSRSIRALIEATASSSSSSSSNLVSANGNIAIAPDAFLPPASMGEKVAFCVLFLGTNDSNLPNHPSHVPLSEFIDNYKTIAKNLLDRSTHGIICVLPPPEHGANLLLWLKEFLPMIGVPPPDKDATPPPTRNARVQEYGNAIRQIAAELEQEQQQETETIDNSINNTQSTKKKKKWCAVVDAFGTFTERFGDCASRDVLCDGLHLGPTGHDVLMELIWNELTQRGLGVDTTEHNIQLAENLWSCPSPAWYMDEVGASSSGMPRSEPSYLAWW